MSAANAETELPATSAETSPNAHATAECDDGTVDTTGDETWAPPASSDRAADSTTTATGASNANRSSSPGNGSGDGSIIGSINWPFDTIPEALEWWYRPVLEAKTWLALAHLFVGAILGPIFFVITLVTIIITGSLVFALVGLLLVVPAFALINGMATIQRGRATWVDTTIPPRRLQRSARPGWSAISTRLGDASRWRQVSFLLLSVVSGPIFFTLGFMPWSILLSGPLGFEFDTFSLGGLLVAALLLGAAPRITVFVADIAVSFAAWFLGPDPSDQLEERVEELSSQREQILDAVAVERRRIERNLHDGVQQQLVALGIDIGRAHARLDTDPEGAKELLGDARNKVRGSIGELRMIGRGLHPAVLSDRGLDAALSAVVASAPIPISVDVTTERELPTEVAETSYYIVSEAVANVLKHARARTASIQVRDEPGVLPAIRITVHDDGLGGADESRSTGSGLAGIAARVAGVDGVFEIESPTGGPTQLTAVIPIRRPRPVTDPDITAGSSPDPQNANEGSTS